MKLDVAVIPELEFDFQRKNILISRELSFESLAGAFVWMVYIKGLNI